MTVEVRENFYYLMEGPAVNPDLVAVALDIQYYAVSGSFIGTQLPAGNAYINEERYYTISGGVSLQTDKAHVNETKYYLIDGNPSERIGADRVSLWQIEGNPQDRVKAGTAVLYIITSN